MTAAGGVGVDVLAVMDAEIQRAGGEAYQAGRDLIEARAAVDELIEAAQDVSRVQINRASPANDMGKAKQLRLRAALSRARGG